MDNEQINLVMEEIEASLSEKSNTARTSKKKRKQQEEEENEKLKHLSERMNNILSNNYQAITESINITSESEVDKMFRKNMIINERIIVVDMMLKLYPQLEKDRKVIIDKVLCTAEEKIELYVLEKITIGNKSFYKDSSGYIVDTDINVVGMCVRDTDDNETFIIYNCDMLLDLKTKGNNLIEKLDQHFGCTNPEIFTKTNK